MLPLRAEADRSGGLSESVGEWAGLLLLLETRGEDL